MHNSVATCISASAASDRPEFVKQSLIQCHLCNDRRRMVGAPMFARSLPQKVNQHCQRLGRHTTSARGILFHIRLYEGIATVWRSILRLFRFIALLGMSRSSNFGSDPQDRWATAKCSIDAIILMLAVAVATAEAEGSPSSASYACAMCCQGTAVTWVRFAGSNSINGKLDSPSFSFVVLMTFLFVCCFQLSQYAQSGAMCARAELLPHLWTEASHGFIPL